MTHTTKKKSIAAKTIIPDGEFKKVPIKDIDPSPFNYRKVFPEKKMAELAASVAIQGVLENLTLRPTPSGRLELVCGERRFRAAKMAGLTEVPAIIKDLTDEQVKELQLTENLQREDPHPLEEAEAIAQLQTRYKSVDEIAARLGKSRAFIYGRMRLLDLIPDLREMFIAEIFTLKQVLEIAALSTGSQQEFYNDFCEDWKEDYFEAPEIPDCLSRFTDDLTEAPFDIKDETLLPDRGACTSCPFNTATLATLFPEEATEAICRDSACYRGKCNAGFTKKLTRALNDHQPTALVFYGSPSASTQSAIGTTPGASSLPQYNYRCLDITCEPDFPDSGDFTEEDTEAFKNAIDDYRAEKEDYDHLWQAGELAKGLLLMDNQVETCLFRERIPGSAAAVTPAVKVTAAAVKEAIKDGSVTPELLRAEITRITTRETRSQQLDKDKLQLNIHERFSALIADLASTNTLTTADETAARFILFESLDYPAREQTLSRFTQDADGFDNEGSVTERAEKLWQLLAGLSAEQYCYLVRVALANRADSKFPSNRSALFLTRMAQDAGLDIASLQKEQQAKVDSRQKSQTERIASLEKKIAELPAV